MKPNKIVAACFIIVSAAGCTKNFDNINTDPTLITKDLMKPSLLLTYVEKNSAFEVETQSIISEFSGYYTNPASGNIFLNRNFGDPFGSYYRNYIINIAEIIRLTADDPTLQNQNAMARIYKAWLYYQLTDAYGDIPYFEAVKDIADLNPQPVYDSQESIYRDIFKELKEATAAISDDAAQKSFGDADLLMKGDPQKWRMFANSLRLRLALRVRYADAALAQENISDVINGPLIDDNSQNVLLATLDDGNVENLNEFYDKNTRQPGNMNVSFTVTDILNHLSDPRLPIFAKIAPQPAAGYRGAPLQMLQNETQRYIEDSLSLMGDYFLQPVFDKILISAAEVKFLRAEAALAGFTAEDAQDLYEQGIQLAMEQYGVAAGDITTYLASAAGTLTGSDEEKLEQIIVQKWLSTYYNVNEGWAEFRRTGYPRIWTGNELGDTGGNIPRRLTYPVEEYFKNESNVTAAASKISGGDKLLGHVWWDQKAGVPFAHPRQGMFPPEDY
jgi:hypothetical protein